jgi:hypothetical protein
MKFTPTHLIAGLALVWLLLAANPASSSMNEELSLSVQPLHTGGWTLAILEGAGPQQNVAFLYSREGIGEYQHTADLVLDLAPPITKVAFTRTNWAGTAMAMIPVGPSIDYHGTQIWGQAVVIDSEGNFSTSPVVTEIVQP